MSKTPMQKQYSEMKAQTPNALLLFRLGDFYECFYDDAITAAKILGITLTGRGKDDNRIPMAGIPYHALANYLPKLLAADIKVAIAEQTTPPGQGKLVERRIVKIYTPGTITDEKSLQSNENNYLAAIFYNKKNKEWGVCFSDLSTGSLNFFTHGNTQVIASELNRLQIKELICASAQLPLIAEQISGLVSGRPDDTFQKGLARVTDQLGTKNLKGFGISDESAVVNALAGIISYIIDCQRTELNHLKGLKEYQIGSYMPLDAATIRNLELIDIYEGTSVLDVIDECATPMGHRLMRNYLVHPLVSKQEINNRLEAVEILFNTPTVIDHLRNNLSSIHDLERIAGRIGLSTANARDLIYLAKALQSVELITNLIKSLSGSSLISQITNQLELSLELKKAISLIENAITPDPPLTITEGGIINSAHNKEISELRELRQNSKQVIARIQEREVSRTGISSLKVGFNNVFGYYLEVTKSHLDKVPADFVRKQTIANGERYITEELKEIENKILNAEEKLDSLEYELFCNIRAQVTTLIPEIQQVAHATAVLDLLVNFAHIARQHNYVKPEIVDSADLLEIQQGRHPVIERLPAINFVANNTQINKDSRIVILTGPNMSGKSTYIRQVALLTLLAQIGSFVPAAKMRFSLVDRIYTRVGAHDNLSKGESTFMVEMNETANILNNATSNSLIILDEVGRGTSTYDGVAIAWSIVEYIHSHIKARTLFATHYHELIRLSQLDGIINNKVKVSEQNGKIKFTHLIEDGSADRSYGIHVAELAGIPKDVLTRAKNILKDFEHSSGDQSQPRRTNKPKSISPQQMGLSW